jgi:hypothetical protein
MVHKGAVHTKALCVMAAQLAAQCWDTNSGPPSGEGPPTLRDVDGKPVDPATAKQIITDHYRRRRSKKSGKAAHTGVRRARSARRCDLPTGQRRGKPLPTSRPNPHLDTGTEARLRESAQVIRPRLAPTQPRQPGHKRREGEDHANSD